MNAYLMRRLFYLGILLIMLLIPFIGMTPISIHDVMISPHENVNSSIFWRIRVPRTLLAFLAGGGLAISGMVFQAIFRNALATPFTLGVSSGASLGAVIYVYMGFSFTVFGLSGSVFYALMGGLFSICLVWGISLNYPSGNTSAMLLSGVAVSMFFSSLVLCVQYMSDFQNSFRIIRWLMGGLETVGYESILQLLPFLVSGLFIVFFHSRELNLLTLGNDLAKSRGVNLDRTMWLLFISVSVMIGGIVSVCGPIGFVGMIIPHICRLISGPMHESLSIVSFLAGGLFLTLCDMTGRTVLAPIEIPVGVITSLFGGPFFLWLLARNRQFEHGGHG